MGRTPEGKVKDMVKKVLEEFEGDLQPYIVNGNEYMVRALYSFWPVPSGFGASSLDCIVSYYGRAIYIEVKAANKKPTPRQELTIAQANQSGALVYVIDGEHGCEQLRAALQLIKLSHANHS
jgi:hypothetical protein